MIMTLSMILSMILSYLAGQHGPGVVEMKRLRKDKSSTTSSLECLFFSMSA